MTLVTQAGDAVLWAALEAKWLSEGSPGWIIHGNIHYEVSEDQVGTVQFLPYTNKSLFDSRSLTKSKTTSYNKLDDAD